MPQERERGRDDPSVHTIHTNFQPKINTVESLKLWLHIKSSIFIMAEVKDIPWLCPMKFLLKIGMDDVIV